MSKELEAKRFLVNVRKTVKRLKIRLQPMQFVKLRTPRSAPECCALGAALAMKAKTKKELVELSVSEVEGEDRPELVARILNGGTSTEDMFQLESGFEDWELSTHVDGRFIRSDASHPFYKIGVALRVDALKVRK